MAKTAGGNRTVYGDQEVQQRLTEMRLELATGNYSDYYFSEEGGGYYVVENSATKHKPEEIEAAKVLADNGYVVRLKDESGDKPTVDGYIFDLSYEQKTPDPVVFADPVNVKNALGHARDKKADIALLFMRKNRHNRQSVEDGIRLYEEKANFFFKKILVVTESGKVYEHHHNKK